MRPTACSLAFFVDIPLYQINAAEFRRLLQALHASSASPAQLSRIAMEVKNRVLEMQVIEVLGSASGVTCAKEILSQCDSFAAACDSDPCCEQNNELQLHGRVKQRLVSRALHAVSHAPALAVELINFADLDQVNRAMDAEIFSDDWSMWLPKCVRA